MVQLLPYAVASFGPALLLGAGAIWGGLWAGLGILAMTVVVFFLDKLAIEQPVSAATGHRLSEALGVMHFVLLGLAVWSVGGPLPLLDKGLIVVGCGLYFGQISNSNAHELIHRADRWAFRLGAANYTALLFGHHTSAHRLVHHVHAATPRDPATAPKGVGFWRYAVRAWNGGFGAGLRAERQRHGGAWLPAPYVGYVLGATMSFAAAASLAGLAGVIGLVTIAAYAQLQLLLSDYVQHYGLERAILPDGRRAAMGPAHSWNAPQWYSSAMMLNAPRHSEHHMKPAKPFPALELDGETMPMLPRSLPVMAVIALIPPLWRKVMDRRVDRWAKTRETALVI
ncbi:alkane 1-monooxygenase [Tateyamaria sp.]|uniref:alkane 1-monooxygenase n=1 Tax=Tateyamaria sp. TaxID=1929288 RepID=UPI003B20F3A7